MSNEQDSKQPETSEQLGQELVEFVRNAEIGSAAYLAASDYFELKRLRKSLSADQRRARAAQESEKKKIQAGESNVRIDEMKIALREHEVKQREQTLKGYGRSYSFIESSIEHLASVAWQEAEEKFPGNDTQQMRYVDDIYEESKDKASDAVYRAWEEDPKQI